MSAEQSTVSFEEGGLEQAAGSVGAPRLVVALSWERPLVPGWRISLGSAGEVFLGRGTRRELRRSPGRLDVMLDDDALSRQHAVLRRVSGGWELEDLGSKNGTMVGGDYYMRTTLADGDVVEIGTTVLVFRDTCPCKDDAPELADRDLELEGDSRLPGVFRTLDVDLERRLAD
ncbi:MAG TPA: FHA domain-containing protein, partial [Kofleriaceae bacterium]|nr:FHA domain-containing protein [Kofleriaceae bacterium]